MSYKSQEFFAIGIYEKGIIYYIMQVAPSREALRNYKVSDLQKHFHNLVDESLDYQCYAIRCSSVYELRKMATEDGFSRAFLYKDGIWYDLDLEYATGIRTVTE